MHVLYIYDNKAYLIESFVNSRWLTATAKSEDLKAAVVQNIKTLVSKSDYSIIQKLFSLQSLPVLGVAVSILLDLADTERCRSLKVLAIKCLTELSQVDGKCEYRFRCTMYSGRSSSEIIKWVNQPAQIIK